MTTINDPLVGTTYDGRYRIERRIGTGGMANVYLAEDETLGRRVAIKVLHQRYAEDSQFIERFLREASAAARLNHPNIVQVYDRGQAEQTYYIAMEYVDGMTLKELVRRRGGLTEQEVLAYARQALHALRFAHRNGIVHRDIKPHNMMVDTDGRLKIADFGIARAGADSGLTEAGSIVGTAQYLSPEQAQGHEVSATSDLYSLGVVMYEMATGRVPFDGESPVNVALKHVKDPVPPPTAIKPELSEPLESIILRAMRKDPAQRYTTADEMLTDLDRARAGSPTQAMTAVMAATQVAPISSRMYEQPIPPEPAWPETGWDEDEEEDRRSRWRWLGPLAVVLALVAAGAWFFVLAPSGEPVPDVTGETLARATADLEDAGFTVGNVEHEFDEEAAKDTVLEQSPRADAEAEAGSEIDLVVSDGPAPVAVPDVTGTTRAEALSTLRSAGFEAVVGDPEPSEDVKAGYVIRQSPRAGEDVDKGATVTIILSSGPEAAATPSVVGMSIDEATALLEGSRYGFVVIPDDVESSQPEGTVIAQDPATGQKLERGAKITLQVASGSNVIPDVVGSTADEATKLLEEAGFTVERVSEPTSDSTKVDTVLGVDPGEGSVRQLGTKITLRVGQLETGDGGGGA